MSETNHLIDLINNREALVNEPHREIDTITSFRAQHRIFTPEITARQDEAYMLAEPLDDVANYINKNIVKTCVEIRDNTLGNELINESTINRGVVPQYLIRMATVNEEYSKEKFFMEYKTTSTYWREQ
eukprot:scaffold849_cov42-Cyclotella_meneghiniana.AAC.3